MRRGNTLPLLPLAIGLPLAAWAQSASDLVSAGDALDAKHRNQEAVDFYLKADAAIRLNPKSDYAWHVLGRWNYELANLNAALRFVAEAIYGKMPDASNERAAECFEKAIALRPDRVIHHVELGRTYAALGRKPEALAMLKKGLSLTSREKDDGESKDRARKAMAALQ